MRVKADERYLPYTVVLVYEETVDGVDRLRSEPVAHVANQLIGKRTVRAVWRTYSRPEFGGAIDCVLERDGADVYSAVYS